MEDTQNPSSVKRLALYGGTFDPIHVAHLSVAQKALDQAEIDTVVFIPSARSPLKAHGPCATDAERLEMLRRATRSEARFQVDTYEIEKGGTSYSLETVAHFSGRFPSADLYWIVGGDQFAQLHRWHRIDELKRKVTFLVVARPGYQSGAACVPGVRYREIQAPLMPENSSDIRNRCARGLPLSGLVVECVEAFISEHKIYRS